MFPQKNRLRRDWEIKRVMTRGKFVADKFFTLKYLSHGKQIDPRATVIVSKKYDKRAVYRNRLKRKFREAAHHMFLSLPQGIDIILLPKTPAAEVSFHEIQEALKHAFEKMLFFLQKTRKSQENL